jgi:hypothetical protein
MEIITFLIIYCVFNVFHLYLRVFLSFCSDSEVSVYVLLNAQYFSVLN